MESKGLDDTLHMHMMFVCVEVLQPSQPNGIMSSTVHTEDDLNLHPIDGVPNKGIEITQGIIWSPLHVYISYQFRAFMSGQHKKGLTFQIIC